MNHLNLNKYNKQIANLFAASVLGMLFGIINSALNTHYLDPISYGDVRYIQNIINFISSILLLGFFVSGSRLLALSKNELQSQQIRGCMVIMLILTIIVLMFCMFFLAMFESNSHSKLSRLFYVSIPVCSNVLLLNYINTTAQGDNHIQRISFARILPPLGYLLIATPIFYLYGASPESMLVLFNGSAVLILGFIIYSTRPYFKNLNYTFHQLFQENKKYGLHVYFGSIAGVSTTYVTGITLGIFCDNNANVGFYTLALTLAVPLSLLPSIIGTTYFKEFTSQNSINPKILRSSIIITIVSYLIFLVGIRILVSIVYPPEYYVVANYASLIAIATSCHGFGDMINRFLGAHGQGKQIRNSSYVCGFVILLGSFVLVYFVGITGAIITKILGSCSYLFMMIFYYREFPRTDSIKQHI